MLEGIVVNNFSFTMFTFPFIWRNAGKHEHKGEIRERSWKAVEYRWELITVGDGL